MLSFVSARLALGKTRAVNSICVFLSVSGTVVLVQYTMVADLPVDPRPWLISEFAAANTANMPVVLFVGSPTTVVICEGFRVNKTVLLVQYTSTVAG